MSKFNRMRTTRLEGRQQDDQQATVSSGIGGAGPLAGLSFDVEFSITPRCPGMVAPEPLGVRPLPEQHHLRDYRSVGCSQIGLTQQQGGGWTMDVDKLIYCAEISDVAPLTYERQGFQPVYGCEESCKFRGESYAMSVYGCPECERIGQFRQYPMFGQCHGLSSVPCAKHHIVGQHKNSMPGMLWNTTTPPFCRKSDKSPFAPHTECGIEDELAAVHGVTDQSHNRFVAVGTTASDGHQHFVGGHQVLGATLGALGDMGPAVETGGLVGPFSQTEPKCKDCLDILDDLRDHRPPDEWFRDLHPSGVLYRRDHGNMTADGEYHQYQGISNIPQGCTDSFPASEHYMDPALLFQSQCKALSRQLFDTLYCDEPWLMDSADVPNLQATQKVGAVADRFGGEKTPWSNRRNNVCELACTECLPKDSSCTPSAATTRASYDFLSSRWFDSEPRDQHLLLLSTQKEIYKANAYLLQTKLPGRTPGSRVRYLPVTQDMVLFHIGLKWRFSGSAICLAHSYLLRLNVQACCAPGKDSDMVALCVCLYLASQVCDPVCITLLVRMLECLHKRKVHVEEACSLQFHYFSQLDFRLGPYFEVA